MFKIFLKDLNFENISKKCIRVSGSFRIHFATLMKNYKSKTTQEVKGTGLEGEELSKNEQLVEDLIERFEDSKRRTEADAQKRQSDIENKKKKVQKSNGKIS